MADPTADLSTSWKDILAKYGAWTVLVFYLLGAIPFVKSPIDRLGDSMKETGVLQAQALIVNNNEIKEQVAKTNALQMEILKTMRAVCRRLPNSSVPCGGA